MNSYGLGVNISTIYGRTAGWESTFDSLKRNPQRPLSKDPSNTPLYKVGKFQA